MENAGFFRSYGKLSAVTKARKVEGKTGIYIPGETKTGKMFRSADAGESTPVCDVHVIVRIE